MRLIAGWRHGKRGSSLTPIDIGFSMGEEKCRTWFCGRWHKWEVRTVRHGATRLIVAGSCAVDQVTLERALAAAWRHDWSALTYWPGSYLAIYLEEDRTVIVNDLAGTWPVHWTRHEGGWLWATSALPLAEPNGRRVDYGFLSASLACPTLEELMGWATPWQNISRLPGGHVLILDADTARPTAYEPMVDSQLPFAQASVRLREALETAVHTRVRFAERVTADFSGGLDSTTIATLAATTQPVFAVTYTDAHLGNTDDLLHAQIAARACPRIVHRIVDGADDALPYTGLSDVPITDAPCLGVLTWERYRRYLSVAANRGSDVHLTGEGGDVVLTSDLAHLADLVRAGRPSEMIRRATAWARVRRKPARAVIGAALRLAVTGYPSGLRAMATELERRPRPWRRSAPRDRLAWEHLSSAAAWLTLDTRSLLAHTIRRTARGAHHHRQPGVLRDQRALHWYGRDQADFDRLGERLGLMSANPYLDNAVVRATLCLASWERSAPDRLKPQLRAAMAGLVPEKILRRHTKNAFDRDHYVGLRSNAEPLRELLSDSQLAANGVIVGTDVLAQLERAVDGLAIPLAGLDSVLATEAWVRAVQRDTTSWWSSTEIRILDA